MRKPPTLRNNNGVVQVRLTIDGKDAFINRIGRWENPAAIARAHAISSRIWSDWCDGTFDQTLRSYQTTSERQDTGLVNGLKHLAESNRQGRTIHAYRTIQRYGRTMRTRSDVDDFIAWMQQQGLKNRTIIGILCECRRVLPGCKSLFTCKLKIEHTPVQSEILSTEEIQMVLKDLQNHEAWFYPLFLLWLSTGLRNGEVRALTWDCVRWSEGELLIYKSLKVDGLSSHRFIPSTTKTGRERVVPLNQQVLKVLQEHQEHMKELNLFDPNGLIFLTPISHSNVYDTILNAVWKRSLLRCGLKPRRLYAQRHSFVSHALAMGNSVADLAAVAGHSTETMLKVYAKPTGRVQMPCWSSS
jgi:site-specific recombinase XerD